MSQQPVSSSKWPPRGLLVTIVILLIVAVIATPIYTALIPPEQLNRYVLVTGIPFLTIFAAIIIGFIYFIWFLALHLNRRVSYRVYRAIELIIIAGIARGVIGLFQGISFERYQDALPILLVSTLAFTAWSHIVPRGQHSTGQDLGPVSIDDDVIPPFPENRHG